MSWIARCQTVQTEPSSIVRTIVQLLQSYLDKVHCYMRPLFLEIKCSIKLGRRELGTHHIPLELSAREEVQWHSSPRHRHRLSTNARVVFLEISVSNHTMSRVSSSFTCPETFCLFPIPFFRFPVVQSQCLLMFRFICLSFGHHF